MDHRPLNFIAILSLSAALSACGGNQTIPNPNLTPTTVEVVVTVPYDCGVPPAIDPVKMRSIHWDWKSLKGNVALTIDDYKLLGMNTSDWLAASKQMKEQRNHYRDCITRSQETQNENVGSSLDFDIPTE